MVEIKKLRTIDNEITVLRFLDSSLGKVLMLLFICKERKVLETNKAFAYMNKSRSKLKGTGNLPEP